MIAIKKLLAALIIVATVTHNVESTEYLTKEPSLELVAVLYRTIANLRARLKTCEISLMTTTNDCRELDESVRKLLDSNDDEEEEKNRKEYESPTNEAANKKLTQPSTRINKFEATRRPTLIKNVDEDPVELDSRTEKSKTKTKSRFGSKRPIVLKTHEMRNALKSDEEEEKNLKVFLPTANKLANKRKPTLIEYVGEDPGELDAKTERSKAAKPRLSSTRPTKQKGSKGDEVEEKNPKEFVPLTNEVANKKLSQPPASINKVPTTIRPTPDVDEDSGELDFKTEKPKAKIKPKFDSWKPKKLMDFIGDVVKEKNPKEIVPPTDEVTNKNLTQPPARINKVATTIKPTSDEYDNEDSDELDSKTETSKAKAKPRYGSRRPTKRKDSKGDGVEEKNPKEFVPPTIEVANKKLTQPPAHINNKVAATIRPTSGENVDEDSDELDSKTETSKAKAKPRYSSRRPTKRMGSKGDEVEENNPKKFVPPTDEVSNKNLTQPPTRINKVATTIKPTSDEYDDEDSDELDFKTEKAKANTKPRFSSPPMRYTTSAPKTANTRRFVNKESTLCNKNHQIENEEDDLKYINIYSLLKLIREKASAEDI